MAKIIGTFGRIMHFTSRHTVENGSNILIIQETPGPNGIGVIQLDGILSDDAIDTLIESLIKWRVEARKDDGNG